MTDVTQDKIQELARLCQKNPNWQPVLNHAGYLQSLNNGVRPILHPSTSGLSASNDEGFRYPNTAANRNRLFSSGPKETGPSTKEDLYSSQKSGPKTPRQ